MSAEQAHPPGLSRARNRILALRGELDWTLDSAERLTRIGQPRLALKIVEEQQRALTDFVEAISADVRAIRPRRLAWMRKRAAALAAAATLVLVALAASIVVAGSGRSGAGDVAARLRRAEQIGDPAARLRSLVAIYQAAKRTPGGSALNGRLAEAAERTRDDLANSRPRDPALVRAADELVSDTREDAQPPSSPPSQSESPIETVKKIVNGG